jgi:hypothetical protein
MAPAATTVQCSLQVHWLNKHMQGLYDNKDTPDEHSNKEQVDKEVQEIPPPVHQLSK